MNIAALGQEGMIRAARDLLASYEKGNGRACLAHMQTLMSELIPSFPHIVTAIALRPQVKAVVDEWEESGAVSDEALSLLWEDYHEAHRGRA
jgi:hypothetical protein